MIVCEGRMVVVGLGWVDLFFLYLAMCMGGLGGVVVRDGNAMVWWLVAGF